MIANVTLGNETLAAAAYPCSVELTLALVFGCSLGYILLVALTLYISRAVLCVSQGYVAVLCSNSGREERIAIPGWHYRPFWERKLVRFVNTRVCRFELPIQSRTNDGMPVKFVLSLRMRNLPTDKKGDWTSFHPDVMTARAVAAVACVSMADLRLDKLAESLMQLPGLFGESDDPLCDSQLQPVLEAVYVTKIE
jgi:hypothetical protein